MPHQHLAFDILDGGIRISGISAAFLRGMDHFQAVITVLSVHFVTFGFADAAENLGYLCLRALRFGRLDVFLERVPLKPAPAQLLRG